MYVCVCTYTCLPCLRTMHVVFILQIVSVNRNKLEFLSHQDVIRMFQENSQVELVVVPVQYADITAVRINPGNPQALSYLWCLTRKLYHLEVV